MSTKLAQAYDKYEQAWDLYESFGYKENHLKKLIKASRKWNKLCRRYALMVFNG